MLRNGRELRSGDIPSTVTTRQTPRSGTALAHPIPVSEACAGSRTEASEVEASCDSEAVVVSRRPLAKSLTRNRRQQTAGMPVCVGLDVDTGNELICDVANWVHTMVVGTVGSGKSRWVTSVLAQIIAAPPQQAALILIDPKNGIDLAAFSDVPHLVYPFVDDAAQAADALAYAVSWMEQCYARMRAAGVRRIEDFASSGESPPRLFIVVEELPDVVMMNKNVVEPLVRLGQKGRAAGVSVIGVAQQNSVKSIPTQLLAVMPTRVCFRVTSTANALMAVSLRGPERFRLPGEFFLTTPALPDLAHGQSLLVQDDQLQGIVAAAKSRFEPATPLVRCDRRESADADVARSVPEELRVEVLHRGGRMARRIGGLAVLAAEASLAMAEYLLALLIRAIDRKVRRLDGCGRLLGKAKRRRRFGPKTVATSRARRRAS